MRLRSRRTTTVTKRTTFTKGHTESSIQVANRDQRGTQNRSTQHGIGPSRLRPMQKNETSTSRKIIQVEKNRRPWRGCARFASLPRTAAPETEAATAENRETEARSTTRATAVQSTTQANLSATETPLHKLLSVRQAHPSLELPAARTTAEPSSTQPRFFVESLKKASADKTGSEPSSTKQSASRRRREARRAAFRKRRPNKRPLRDLLRTPKRGLLRTSLR
jgi:hypothetical protein